VTDDAPGTAPAPQPQDAVAADDTMTADRAFALLRRGTPLLWQGDYQGARQLLQAVGRRLTKQQERRGKKGRGKKGEPPRPEPDVTAAFRRQRADRAGRARVLGLVHVDLTVRDGEDGPEYVLDLRRAPDVAAACAHAWGSPAASGGDSGAPGDTRRVQLTELQGVLGAYQWHVRGVEVAALGERVYPDYTVFSPTRSEYVDLVDRVAAQRLPAGASVLEIGTGTGVLAVVLARRGAGHVTATDVNPRAVACARGNLDRLGVGQRCTVVAADLWPDATRHDVVVVNPPWLPGTPTSELELGIYDDGSGMLRRFLAGLADHLTDGGEGWLVISDLAEQLGLRRPDDLERWIADAGLQVLSRDATTPVHPRSADTTDPVYLARSREVTSLWRLGRGPGRG
jgi:methylase of polypeptide subunit release factors